MTNIPDRGSDRPCTFCAVPRRNEHSIKQSAECDGIRTNKITGTRQMQIRLRNSGKSQRRRED